MPCRSVVCRRKCAWLAHPAGHTDHDPIHHCATGWDRVLSGNKLSWMADSADTSSTIWVTQDGGSDVSDSTPTRQGPFPSVSLRMFDSSLFKVFYSPWEGTA